MVEVNENNERLAISDPCTAVCTEYMVCVCGSSYCVRMDMLDESLASAKRLGWIQAPDGTWTCFDCAENP